MEPIRFGLIAALAVVTYILFLQWQEDYGQTQYVVEETLTSPAAQNSSSTPPLPDLSKPSSDLPQGSVQPAKQGGGDLPVVNLDESKPQATSDDVPQATVTNELIQVSTPLFAIKIDPVGGDLVYAALKEYPIAVDQPDQPFVMLNRSANHVYVAQSGVIGKKGTDLDSEFRPLYHSKAKQYELQGDTLEVPLYYDLGNGVSVVKRYIFAKDSYAIKIEHEIINQSSEPWAGAFFAQIKRDGSKDPGAKNGGPFSMPTYLGTAYWLPDERYNKLAFKKIAEAKEEHKTALKETVKGGWAAMIQHYFLTAWIPSSDTENTYTARLTDNGEYIIGLTSPAVKVLPGSHQVISASYYIGPKVQDKLKALSDGLNLAVDYGFLYFIAEILFWLLIHIHGIVGNWGWSIILLTVLVKGLFFPLSATSYRSMANMRKFQPKIQELRERHGDDRQAMSQAMMKLYKEEKINPLGGCLPILVQMPVFISLYWTLLESVELRHADFIFWINDLSVKDPFYVLPLLMGATMWFQQKLNPAPPDPTQAKVMQIMPLMFTGFFMFFPAGLVLYWFTNNLLSIAQQWFVTKRVEAGK